VREEGGLNFSAAWGSAPDDIWAVGSQTMHWNGKKWSIVEEVSRKGLSDVWGSGPDDVWAVSDWGSVFHWDGRTWSVVWEPTSNSYYTSLSSVWGTAPDDVWACGYEENFEDDGSLVLHWDGDTWSLVPGGGRFNDIWGSSPDDLWGVGHEISHWDGNAWEHVLSAGTMEEFHAVGGIGGDVWVVGDRGVILHRQGNQHKE
jgi:hypothetical protein